MKLKQNENNKSQVQSYEIVRFIATILVVIGHSNYLYTMTHYGGLNFFSFNVSNILTNTFLFKINHFLIEFIYIFHMPLFFMLSGAIFALSPAIKFRLLIKKKVKRLLIPYLVYGLAFMFPIKFATGFYDEQGIVKAAISFFYSTADSGHLWFLPTLFLCFVIFKLLQIILERLNLYSPPLMIVISLFLYLVSNFVNLELFAIKRVLQNMLWFSIGYFFESYRSTLINYSNKLIISLSLAVSAFSVCIFLSPYFTGFVLVEEVSILVLCFNVYVVSELLSRFLKKYMSNMFYKIVVRNLFYIYLFHDPLEYIILKIFFNTTALYYPVYVFLYYFCRFVVVIIVSVLLGEFIRKIKCYVFNKRKKINN